MILEIKHVYKDYFSGNLVVPVLKDINLQVEEGEYLAIMGPSGSGKSTLMNIIGCLDKPTKGEFYLGGENILSLRENSLADVRLSHVASHAKRVVDIFDGEISERGVKEAEP